MRFVVTFALLAISFLCLMLATLPGVDVEACADLALLIMVSSPVMFFMEYQT